MTRRLWRIAVMMAALVFGGMSVHAQSVPGKPAPVFSAQSSSGEAISLEALRGQWVMLEWTNHDCPYVRKHYETGNMQALQRDMREEGFVWLSVISSAPGKQGHVDAQTADVLTEEREAAPSYVLLDPEGAVGRLYRARTTPEMVIIDPEGLVRYHGAIDDKPSTRHATVETAQNYVRAAWAELKAGQTVSTPVTKPYGCSVKY